MGGKRRKKDEGGGENSWTAEDDSDDDGDKYQPFKIDNYCRQYPEDGGDFEYMVIYESADESKPIGDRDLMGMGAALKSKNKGIKRLKRINRYKIAVIYERPGLANAALSNIKALKELKLKATIPARLTEVVGVIKNVPIYMSNQNIYNGLSSGKNVVSVRRFLRRARDEEGNSSLLPTTSVAITFACPILPANVDINSWYFEMPELTVRSEIYDEYNYKTGNKPSKEGNVISEFPFLLPPVSNTLNFDDDEDLDVERPQKEVIKIEHSSKTKISLVGLQVWRGAFLLGDLLIHLGHAGLGGKTVMELGAGTGLTSFVAAIYAKKVLCTDINMGGILELIKLNVKYNSKLIKSHFKVMPLDFTNTDWDQPLLNEIKKTDIIIAADVIYDDDVTAGFVSTIQKILNTAPPKTLYIVLEKRYVFTIEHMDSVAPCYETFLSLLDKVKINSDWTIEQLALDFPKYFTYERVKELVLWKITSRNPKL